MPNGKKTTKTDPLKAVVKKWGTDLEAKFNHGEVRDPRAGEIKVGEWHQRVSTARVVDTPTRKKNASLWRTHCDERWASWPMNAITRMEAQEWVNELCETRRARHKGREVANVPFLAAATIRDIVFVMGGLYKAAMKEHPPIVLTNPFADLELPKRSARAVEFYERDEATALYAALERTAGLRGRTLVELGMDVGLRPGEIYGLHGHRVDWLRGRLSVTHVMTREGLREYPKSMRSRRTVPVPPGTLESMSTLMIGRPRDALVFTAPGGGQLDDGAVQNRIWYPAVTAAGIRRFPPQIMRQTAASWLVQDGVPLYDVQALLGHEDFSTTQRYAHLAPDAHSRVMESWARRPGAPVAHGQQRGGSS